MRVVVIGGSGRCGKLVMEELLNRGHQVTVLARNPASMGDARPGLKIVKGTPTNFDDVLAAFQADVPAVVIVTLNAPGHRQPLCGPHLSAPPHGGLQRQRYQGHETIRCPQDGHPASLWRRRVLGQHALRAAPAYERVQHVPSVRGPQSHYREVRESGVDFVKVRPSRLVETDQTEVKVWPNDGKGVCLMASTSRISVARWLVEAAETTKWDNTAPVISN